ncbi:hypothetical protein ABIB17_001830 [Arthrobacter sp. UYEF6]
MQQRLAILDDYQDVAHAFADWASLEGSGVATSVFREPFQSEHALAAALADYQIVIAMRERTPFPRTVLERLPGLKLLVTTGMANAGRGELTTRRHVADVRGHGAVRQDPGHRGPG